MFSLENGRYLTIDAAGKRHDVLYNERVDYMDWLEVLPTTVMNKSHLFLNTVYTEAIWKCHYWVKEESDFYVTIEEEFKQQEFLSSGLYQISLVLKL